MMWWIYALLSALFAALTAIFAKIGIANVNTNLATAIRTCVILLVAWGIVFARSEQKGLATLSKHNLLFLVISGLATGLSWLCYFRALQMGPASSVAPVDKLSVVLVILFAWVFLGEHLSLLKLAGGSLITIGAILIAFA